MGFESTFADNSLKLGDEARLAKVDSGCSGSPFCRQYRTRSVRRASGFVLADYSSKWKIPTRNL
jgi:hypothetical protein